MGLRGSDMWKQWDGSAGDSSRTSVVAGRRQWLGKRPPKNRRFGTKPRGTSYFGYFGFITALWTSRSKTNAGKIENRVFIPDALNACLKKHPLYLFYSVLFSFSFFGLSKNTLLSRNLIRCPMSVTREPLKLVPNPPRRAWGFLALQGATSVARSPTTARPRVGSELKPCPWLLFLASNTHTHTHCEVWPGHLPKSRQLKSTPVVKHLITACWPAVGTPRVCWE